MPGATPRAVEGRFWPFSGITDPETVPNRGTMRPGALAVDSLFPPPSPWHSDRAGTWCRTEVASNARNPNPNPPGARRPATLARHHRRRLIAELAAPGGAETPHSRPLAARKPPVVRPPLAAPAPSCRSIGGRRPPRIAP